MNIEIERGIMGFTLKTKILNEFIGEFQKTLFIKNLTEATKIRYNRVIRYFCDFLTNQRIKSHLLTQINQSHIESFIHYRLSQNIKPNSMNYEIKVLKALFNEAIRKKYLVKSPLKGIKLLKVHETIPKVYTIDEIRLILDFCKNDETFSRHYLIFAMLYFTAIRFGELQNLEWSDIDFENNIIKIQNKPYWSPKTTKARKVPLNDSLSRELYIRSLSQISNWVIVNANGNQITEVRTLRVLRKILKRLNIPYGTIHMFRHSAATHMLSKGASLVDVKEYLGHSNIRTTEIYLHLLPDSLYNAAQKLQDICTESAQSNIPESDERIRHFNNKGIPFDIDLVRDTAGTSSLP